MMKKWFVILVVSLFTFNSSVLAQYVTPGNGEKYTLADFVKNSNGVVTFVDGVFSISENLMLSATDTLEIVTNDTVRFAESVQFDVKGVFLCNPTQEVVFTAIDTTLNYKGFRFDGANGSIIQNACIEFAGGTRILHSDMSVHNCRFYKNDYSQASGAIDIIGCDPLIENCLFEQNEQSAIMTGVNASASPTILNCRFIANNTSNSNRPQINLGSGSSNPIVLQGNYIEGAYTRAGGISVAQLVGSETITVVIDSNTIINNRYGINMQGAGLIYTITNNIITDNNIEGKPMKGGSGISFNGLNKGEASGNIITGNLWGVTIMFGAQPNLGQIDPEEVNRGENWIYDNGNNGVIYNLYNNTPNLIYAENNYWGTENQDDIENTIVHQTDDSEHGFVDYLPYYHLSGDNELRSFSLSDGEVVYDGVIDNENGQVSVSILSQSSITSFVANFEVFGHATVWIDTVQQFSGITINNYSEPISFKIVAENGNERFYTIKAMITSVMPGGRGNLQIMPNPASESVFINSELDIQKVVLISMDGKTILEKSRGVKSIDVSTVKSGLYLIKIDTLQGSVIKELIVKH